MLYRFKILGCGSSGGVPRLSDGWGLCDPNNIKNNRLRCSILLTHETLLGKSWYLIDTSPDLRQQLFIATAERDKFIGRAACFEKKCEKTNNVLQARDNELQP